MDTMQFYPTPSHLIEKMLAPYIEKVDTVRHTFRVLNCADKGQGILEPSAGNGDILDYLKTFRNIKEERFFVVEMEPERQAVLQSKGYPIHGMDIMEWDEAYLIELIVANPPFAQGAEHLLKMWDIVMDGGKVICLLNAETLRNPYSKDRQRVVSLVQQYGTYEYVQGAFSEDAERKTDVECVIVWLDKPERERENIFEGLEFDEEKPLGDEEKETAIAFRPNEIQLLVDRYERAREALIEYHKHLATFQLLSQGIYDKWKLPEVPSLNKSLSDMKVQYWGYVFNKSSIRKRITKQFAQEFAEYQQTVSGIAFNIANINRVIAAFIMGMDTHLHRGAVGVFERIRGMDKTNTQGEGWKSNKRYRLNHRLVIPSLVRADTYDLVQYMYHNWDIVDDLEKVLCSLVGVPIDSIVSAKQALEAHGRSLNSRWEVIFLGDGKEAYQDKDGNIKENAPQFSDRFESTFFECRAYKKGTMHLYFRDKDHLALFNRFISDGSLPGSED